MKKVFLKITQKGKKRRLIGLTDDLGVSTKVTVDMAYMSCHLHLKN